VQTENGIDFKDVESAVRSQSDVLFQLKSSTLSAKYHVDFVHEVKEKSSYSYSPGHYGVHIKHAQDNNVIILDREATIFTNSKEKGASLSTVSTF
jgi:hypothetical protein